MADLTAAEIQALAALADNHPMTIEELARSVADVGHVPRQRGQCGRSEPGRHGHGERTPAISLGKYRITANGRAWILARTG